MSVTINCADLTDRERLHDRLAAALELPAWYGRNLDALYDCLTTPGRPIELTLTASEMLETNLGDYGRSLLQVLRDAARRPGARLTLRLQRSHEEAKPSAPEASPSPIDFRKKKLFLLDMDGTLYLGDRLFDGTVDFLSRVKEQGGRYLFATNNSSRGVGAYVERMARFGIAASPDDFLTSTDALIWYLRKHYQDPLIYAFGTATFRGQLRDAGFRVTDRLEDNIGLLVCGFDTELTFQKLEDACVLLTTRRADFLATNPDWVCPTDWGSVPDCGSVCEMLFRATGRRPKFIGKPEPDMALLSMERCHASPEETVLIGDRIYTDIACGVNAGVDTAFVLSGEGVIADIETYHVQPTGVYRDIREIWGLMG